MGQADVIDATVVLCVQSQHGVVLTTDAADLQQLDPRARIITV